jgi:hypothetical protein
LPFLIEGCNDGRYSRTAHWSEDDFYSWSVGAICLDIIASHVEVFRNHIGFNLPEWHEYTYVGASNHKAGDERAKHVADWWREHKGMSIRELQISAFDSAIEKRKQDVKRSLLGKRLATGKEADEITHMTFASDALKRGNQSLPPETMRPARWSTGRYTVAPWTGRKTAE